MRHHLDPDEWIEARGDIFALYKQLGIKDEERHQLQHAVTGCSSLRFMTCSEHVKLIESLQELATKPPNERSTTIRGLLTLTQFDYQEDC